QRRHGGRKHWVVQGVIVLKVLHRGRCAFLPTTDYWLVTTFPMIRISLPPNSTRSSIVGLLPSFFPVPILCSISITGTPFSRHIELVVSVGPVAFPNGRLGSNELSPTSRS